MIITSFFPSQIAEVGAYSKSRTQLQILRPCGGFSTAETAKLDAKDPQLVIYYLTIRNGADATRVVAITDHLPDGMRLISSSVPFSSYDDGVVTWRLTDLEPLGTETISYKVEALRCGTFVNWAEIEVEGLRLPDRGFSYTTYPSGTDCQGIIPRTSFDVGDSTKDV